jgi:sRNA-binding regulator protein Hfq
MNDDHDQVRRDQTDYARRTLGVKEGYRSNGSSDRGPRGDKPARRVHVPKGHDAILADLQERQASVDFTIGDSAFKGRVIGRDKFTITVRTVNGRARVVYKHAIDWFEEGV